MTHYSLATCVHGGSASVNEVGFPFSLENNREFKGSRRDSFALQMLHSNETQNIFQ